MDNIKISLKFCILEMILVVGLCLFIQEKLLLVEILSLILLVMVVLQSFFLIKSLGKKHKNRANTEELEEKTIVNEKIDKEKNKVTNTLEKKEEIKNKVDIRKELRKNITKEITKLSEDFSKDRDSVIADSLSDAVGKAVIKKEKVKQEDIVKNVNNAVENTYKDIYTQVRNKLSESNEELISKIEYQVKDYVGASEITDDILINIEINEMLDESIALYNREIKQLLSRQENTLMKEIDKSINVQLRDSKAELEKNNVDFESLNKMLKVSTNEIIKEYSNKNDIQIRKVIDNINADFKQLHESVNYEKVSEDIKKNLEKFKENYMNSVQKNIDSTIDIVKGLAEIGISNFKLIRKQEIKLMFQKALEGADTEIDIYTTSINNAVMFKEHIYDKLKAALKRKVKINIIYDNLTEKGMPEMQKASDNIAKDLLEDFSGYGNNFSISNKNIRETMLICDNKFAIVGEFNYLAYEGKSKDVNEGKEEMAAIITEPKLIEILRYKKIN